MTVLAPHELSGSTWLKLKEYLEQRLDHFRKQNDANIDITETTLLRGRIREIKNLLSLGEPQGATTATGDDE